MIDLFLELGRAAKEKKTAVVFFIDELQYVEEEQFGSLITALHKCAQLQLPIALIGAGLPQLVGRAGRASYAERLFEYPEIGPLKEEEARRALVVPAKELGVDYEEEALEEILAQTKAYPYFLQEWGKHSWHCAVASPITREDAISATELAIQELDASFLGCDSTGSRLRRSDICVPWLNWVRGRTALVKSPIYLTKMSRPLRRLVQP